MAKSILYSIHDTAINAFEQTDNDSRLVNSKAGSDGAIDTAWAALNATDGTGGYVDANLVHSAQLIVNNVVTDTYDIAEGWDFAYNVANVIVDAAADPVSGEVTVAGDGTGTVTTMSVVSANGFAGSVANATTTPAVTISTTITGIVKGNGTAISAATVGTDYSGGTAALATGILKSTTTTGALTIAVAGDFPTLNQNTTGTASNVTGTVAIANGGTGATTFSGAQTGLGFVVAALGSNVTTTGQVLVDATGLRIVMAANETWAFKFVLRAGSDDVAGIKVGLNIPALATMVACVAGSNLAGAASEAVLQTSIITADATAGIAYAKEASQDSIIIIEGTCVNGANAGDLQLQFLKVTSGTATIATGSFVQGQRIS